MKQGPYRTYLTEKEFPRTWYNLKADMKEQHDPFLHPGTLQPITAADLEGVFCKEVIEQELNCSDRYIDIPEEILEIYKVYRPSPLCRAYNLEQELGTPAKIYYKFEGLNTSGSHKLNSAVAQAYYSKKQGLSGITTETGAGQWGTALAMACAFFKLDLKVFMVKVSAEQKPYRKAVIENFGAEVIPSPSTTTAAGRGILAEYPEHVGSLGCAISEAMEVSTSTPGYRYCLGSVLDHVMLHQSIIGEEALIAFDMLDEYPDIVIGCAGGGSNLGGIIAPFMGKTLRGEKPETRFIAVEPTSCPSLTRGKYVYDFGDTGKMTPLMRMYTLGSGYQPVATHSGGLRYHGMSPIISKLYHDGHIEAMALPQQEIFDAAKLFSRTETILPAPESNHAIAAAIREALKCKETGEEKTILFNLSGTGYFDMAAYMSYNEGRLVDAVPTDADLQKGFDTIPNIPVNAEALK